MERTLNEVSLEEFQTFLWLWEKTLPCDLLEELLILLSPLEKRWSYFSVQLFEILQFLEKTQILHAFVELQI